VIQLPLGYRIILPFLFREKNIDPNAGHVDFSHDLDSTLKASEHIVEKDDIGKSSTDLFMIPVQK
jgi:hypothetical protein